MGAVAVGRVLGLATAAEGKGLASDGIDLVRRGLPAHRTIIQGELEKGSASWGRWKAGGWWITFEKVQGLLGVQV